MGETPTQVFACEICPKFKNTSFEERVGTTASGLSKIPTYNTAER